jgi:hypothetical protein
VLLGVAMLAPWADRTNQVDGSPLDGPIFLTVVVAALVVLVALPWCAVAWFSYLRAESERRRRFEERCDRNTKPSGDRPALKGQADLAICRAPRAVRRAFSCVLK